MKFSKQPILNVGILLGRKIEFELKGVFSYQNETINPGLFSAEIVHGKIITPFASGLEIQIQPAKNATFLLKGVTIGIGFHWEQQEDQEFEGGLKLIIENGEIRAINIVPIENYLKSVISSEMSAMNDMTLLKTHAIVSRSWLLAQVANKHKMGTADMEIASSDDVLTKQGKDCPGFSEENPPNDGSLKEIIKWYDREDHENYDVCADDHCQRYQGITKVVSANAAKAVQETEGLVLTYNNEICDARFSKCCGGISEDFDQVWQPKPIPYLSSVMDAENKDLKIDDSFFKNDPKAFCNTNDKEILKQVLIDFDQKTTDFFRWHVEFLQIELADLLKRKSGIDFGNIIDLIPLERGKSGRISRLEIIGTKNSIVVGKELEIRKWLSESHLYSSAFIIEKNLESNEILPSSFVLIGAGWGHGVGMCQIGAAVMSNRGYKMEEILTHYFIEAEVNKIY